MKKLNEMVLQLLGENILNKFFYDNFRMLKVMFWVNNKRNWQVSVVSVFLSVIEWDN